MAGDSPQTPYLLIIYTVTTFYKLTGLALKVLIFSKMNKMRILFPPGAGATPLPAVQC